MVICVGPPSIYPATSMCLPIFPTSMCHSLYPMRSYSVMQHHCSCVSRLSHCTCIPSARFVCASLGSGLARIAGTLTQLAWGVRAKAFVSASLGLALSSCVCELGARTQISGLNSIARHSQRPLLMIWQTVLAARTARAKGR